MSTVPALARFVAAAALVVASTTCAVGTHLPGGDGASTTTGTTTGSTTSSTSSTGVAPDGGDAGQDVCATPADCPAPPDACTLATCSGGVCGTADAPQGTVVSKDSPANCHSLICDGMGHAQMGVDPTNVPVSSNPCLVGTCDAAGNPGTAPAAARVACSSSGGKLCDGNGSCVACLLASDCPAGEMCSIVNACTGSHCTDGVKDVDETDVDCGGSTCSPCATGRMCKVSSDCASADCSSLYLVCLSSTCSDGAKDGNETDVDCGGSCDPCAAGKTCVADQDCVSAACDAISLTCVSSQCADHQQDGSESDVDCGGSCAPCALGQRCKYGTDCTSGDCGSTGTCVTPDVCKFQTDVGCGGGGGCPPCPLGDHCKTGSDCQSTYCNLMTHTCVSDHCFDYALDGDETDVDCGGLTCAARCAYGKWCNTANDCTSGLTCAGNPPTCG